MESIHLGAFENLKLIVELDFSWNKLTAIPVRQMSHLSLLRRLSMRGNPLGRLTTDETVTTNAKRGASGPADRWARLVETYPELVRSLLKLADTNSFNAINTGDSSDQTKVLQMLANLMHKVDTEQVNEGASDDDDDDDDANQLNGYPEEDQQEQQGENSVDNEQTNGTDRKVAKPLSLYFKHLQELDLGQCKLTYIKWTTLANLNSLKRLYLDGNQLR